MKPFLMPSLGADMEAGFLRTWNVKTGQPVHRGDIIAEVETHKGILDIEIFEEGIIGKLLVQLNDRVPVGTVLLNIYSPEEWQKEIQPALETAAPVVPQAVAKSTEHAKRASPLARKLAEELHVDLTRIAGTGPSGAITRGDVEGAAALNKEEVPKPVTDLRIAIASAVSQSNREIPAYHLMARADVTSFLDHLAELNRVRTVQDRLLPIALLLRYVSRALRSTPELRARWENKPVAVDEVSVGLVTRVTHSGLVIPVIRDADLRTNDTIMQEISSLILRARSGHLRSSELQPATISISSMTEGPSETVLGIIYPPQSALVGFGAVHDEPWAINGMLAIRRTMNITLTADHRLTDGTVGNRFLLHLTEAVHNPKNHD